MVHPYIGWGKSKSKVLSRSHQFFTFEYNFKCSNMERRRHKLAKEMAKVSVCLEVSSALLLNTNLMVQMWKGATINWLNK
jgi:hypothetical protein